MTMVTERQRRWLTSALVLGTLVLGLILISLVASIFFAFGDIVLVFFLAWLLAFILSPVVAGLTRPNWAGGFSDLPRPCHCAADCTGSGQAAGRKSPFAAAR